METVNQPSPRCASFQNTAVLLAKNCVSLILQYAVGTRGFVFRGYDAACTGEDFLPTLGAIRQRFADNFASNVLAGGDGCIAALSNVVPEVCAAWAQAFRDNDLEGISKGQKTINRLMDLYAIRDPFLPVLKEACKLRGIASSSVGTFPMPNATVEDDAKISLLLSAEGIR